jgi:FkbM family methyltransferase
MYQRPFKTRTELVDGEGDWLWPASDSGAWEGPKNDWLTSHRDKYFKYLKKRDYVVTAGGNCGLYVRQYAKLFKTVYAFEPDPMNFHCMVTNSQFENVVKMQCALGKESKMISMNTGSLDNVGAFTINDHDSTAIIPMIPLDFLNLPGCDLLQLDVEGYEDNVLDGAQVTIQKYRPVLILESAGAMAQLLLHNMNYEYVENSVSDKIFVPK